MKNIFAASFFLLFYLNLTAQSGLLQIYCDPEVSIYIDDQFKGKTTADMSGLLVENLPVKEVNVRAYKKGFTTQTKTVTVVAGKVVEVRFEMQPEKFRLEKIAGLSFHFGTFGLFNVNSNFTKADFTFGSTLFIDFKFHPNFAIGTEVMAMWGKPKTPDPPRQIICPNLRLHAIFSPFEKINFDILVASGFTLWPSNKEVAYLTPTLNDLRMGWDFRAMAGAEFILKKAVSLHFTFGYWASSSTSDNVVWITHDTMLLSFGPQIKF